MGLKAAVGIYIFTYICTRTQGNKKCYFAKTCIHDAQEKCGEDQKGNVRRFLDSCDMKEYNCLEATEYKKIPIENCESLPPIEETSIQTKDSPKDKNEKYNKSEIVIESEEGSKTREEFVHSEEQENVSYNEALSQDSRDEHSIENEESQDDPRNKKSLENQSVENEDSSYSKASEADAKHLNDVKLEESAHE